MGMTLTEKILARKTGQAKVSPGDLVTVGVDTVVFVDTMFVPGRWRKIRQLDHPERVIVVLDHRAPVAGQAGRGDAPGRARVRRAIRHQALSRHRLRSGHQPSAGGGLRLRVAGHAVGVQRFAHRQRGRIQLPRARSRHPRRRVCRDTGRNVVHRRRDDTLRARGQARPRRDDEGRVSADRRQVRRPHQHERRVRRVRARAPLHQRAQDADDHVDRAVRGFFDFRCGRHHDGVDTRAHENGIRMRVCRSPMRITRKCAGSISAACSRSSRFPTA